MESRKPKAISRKAWQIGLLVLLIFVLLAPFLIFRLGMQARLVSYYSLTGAKKQTPPPARRNERVYVELVRAIDADTLEVRFAGGPAQRVQLLGVDGPELWRREEKLVNKKRQSVWVPVGDPKARQAQEKLQKLLSGRKISLEFEAGEPPMDRYGRLLSWVWAEDKAGKEILVNAWVVEEGVCEVSDYAQNARRLKYASRLEDAKRERERRLSSSPQSR